MDSCASLPPLFHFHKALRYRGNGSQCGNAPSLLSPQARQPVCRRTTEAPTTVCVAMQASTSHEPPRNNHFLRQMFDRPNASQPIERQHGRDRSSIDDTSIRRPNTRFPTTDERRPLQHRQCKSNRFRSTLQAEIHFTKTRQSTTLRAIPTASVSAAPRPTRQDRSPSSEPSVAATAKP